MTDPQATPASVTDYLAAALTEAHERIEAQTTTKCLLLEELAAMMAERKELETQRATELETAYREGFTDGDCYRNGPNPTPEGAGFRAWLDSDTKAHLDQPGDAQEKEAAP